MATANDAMATAIFRMRFCAIISTSSFGVVDTAAADTDDDAVLSPVVVVTENRLVPVLLLSPSSFSLVDGMYGTDSPKLLLVDVDASLLPMVCLHHRRWQTNFSQRTIARCM